MIINRVKLSGFNYPEVNSDYFFKSGLNIICGGNVTGKSTIINSIVSGFSAETFDELWDGFQYYILEYNQDAIITIQFQLQQASYCLTKKIQKNGFECQIHLIDEQGEKSQVCEGTEAMGLAKQFSKDIFLIDGSAIDFFRGGGYYPFILEKLGNDGQSMPEFQNILNELWLEYGSNRIGLQARFLEGRIELIDYKGSIHYPNLGTASMFSLFSLFALAKMNKLPPIIITEDEWWRHIDHERREAVAHLLSALGEVVASQTIVGLHSQHRDSFDAGQITIELGRR